MEIVVERVRAVAERLRLACARGGRPPEAVTVVAVSKNFPAERVAEAAAAGLLHFGENRVQEAGDKIPRAPAGLVWHLVGSLQRNKAQAAVRLFSWIHSVDSLELARTLDARAAALGRKPNVLLEVKLSPEATKHGVPPEEAGRLVREMLSLAALSVRGLMTIAPLSGDPEAARPCFRQLAALGREIRVREGLADFDQLSMGMSQDYEVAVEEGATLVRIGTAIFGPR